MARDLSKTPSGSAKSAVKQTKGPGMNLGLKKPRKKMAQPKDYSIPRPIKGKLDAATGSYLPDTLGLGKKKKPKF